MPNVASLASALTSKVTDKTAPAFLIELDKTTDAPIAASTQGNRPSGVVSFQYYPESITDSKNVNYQTKEIPGGSLPLYQWISSGERVISFTAQFTCDVDLSMGVPIDEFVPASVTQQAQSIVTRTVRQRLKSAGATRRNPDLRGAIAWLRRFTLPEYKTDGNQYLTLAPPKLRLLLPGSGIGIAGGAVPDTAGGSDDAITCLMTQCEVSYDAFFPTGIPRSASVSLSFAQVPQLAGAVYFPRDSEALWSRAKLYTDLF